MGEALVIIDVQNDYFEGGAYPLYRPERALANIRLLAEEFVEKGRSVYFIRHISRSEKATFFLPGTPGADIHSSLASFPSSRHAHVIDKAYPNSFLRTALQESLLREKIDQLILCGMMTHMCVDSTTRQAKELGYKVKLIADACATRDLTFGRTKVSATDVQNAFLSALSDFSEVISTRTYLSNDQIS